MLISQPLAGCCVSRWLSVWWCSSLCVVLFCQNQPGACSIYAEAADSAEGKLQWCHSVSGDSGSGSSSERNELGGKEKSQNFQWSFAREWNGGFEVSGLESDWFLLLVWKKMNKPLCCQTHTRTHTHTHTHTHIHTHTYTHAHTHTHTHTHLMVHVFIPHLCRFIFRYFSLLLK